MIPIDVIESTANELMAKAAIEIPDDYLTGLTKAADSEDGGRTGLLGNARALFHVSICGIRVYFIVPSQRYALAIEAGNGLVCQAEISECSVRHNQNRGMT